MPMCASAQPICVLFVWHYIFHFPCGARAHTYTHTHARMHAHAHTHTHTHTHACIFVCKFTQVIRERFFLPILRSLASFLSALECFAPINTEDASTSAAGIMMASSEESFFCRRKHFERKEEMRWLVQV